MTVELLILLVAVLVAIVVIVWRWLHYRDMAQWHRSEYATLRTQLRDQQEAQIDESASDPRSLIKQTVVINTRDGRTLRGVIMSEHVDRITLAEVFYLAGSGEHQLAGVTHVFRNNISFLQEVVLTAEVAYEEAPE